MSEDADGPIERQRWPERLPGHAVEPGDEPRLHGFDVQSDLARHYSASELMLIALLGDAPSSDVGRALDVALAFAAPVSVAEAPAHAAAISRLCGARTAGIVGVAAVALAEGARVLVDEHEAALPHLLVGSLGPEPSRFTARDDADRAAVRRLRVALGPFSPRVPAFEQDLRLDTAIVAVLLACGLRTREQLEIALVWGRLPVTCAEALAWKPGDLRAYPMDLPRFRYESERR